MQKKTLKTIVQLVVACLLCINQLYYTSHYTYTPRCYGTVKISKEMNPLIIILLLLLKGLYLIYLLPFIGCIFFFYILMSKTTWFESHKLRWRLLKQGIKGPRSSVIYGNVPQMKSINATTVKASQGDFVAHDYTSTLFPYLEKWRKEYGTVYTYSTGNKQHLYVNDPELVKEMNQSNTLDLGKPSYVTKKLAPLLGNGILRSNGHIWAQQRKIVAPEFFMDKVKCMVGLMAESVQPLLRKWESGIDAQGCEVAEVEVDEDLRNISADIISKACFGSSYSKGKEIFSKLRTLQKTISQSGFLFALPTFGLFSSGIQKEAKELEKEIDSLIWEAIRQRQQELALSSSSNEKSLMLLILQGAFQNNSSVANKTNSSAKKFIVDNCKNMYFAGHESTAVAASWCLMMLALHPEWQVHVREEMARVCPDGVVHAHSLPKLKMVTMVIQETMRLYPPAAFVSREALQETQLGHIAVPKGVCIWTLIPTLHRDQQIWGPDANAFKPERFAKGISGTCKVPHAYVPFGLGPRLCLGRNFAVAQLKVVLSLVVSKFSFSLSPNYRHSPAYRMIVEPGDGVQIIISKCEK